MKKVAHANCLADNLLQEFYENNLLDFNVHKLNSKKVFAEHTTT